MGGQTVPLVAARRPLRHLVYLCGVPPTPGQPFAQQMADETDMLNPDYTRGLGDKDSDGRRSWIDKELTHFHVMNDCDEATASAAFARLRPQSLAPYKIPCSLHAYPVVETTYIVCEEDQMVNPAWSRRIARDWLDAELIELPGATHRSTRALRSWQSSSMESDSRTPPKSLRALAACGSLLRRDFCLLVDDSRCRTDDLALVLETVGVELQHV